MLFALFSWFIFGLIVGAIARLLMPGSQPMGILGTMFLGVVGSFVGGFIGFLLVGGSFLQASGWIGSIIGAILVLFLSAQYGNRRVRA